MAALEAGEPHGKRGQAVSAEHGLERDREVGTGPAGAADVDRPLFLGVEIEQTAGDKALRIEARRAGETGLFVDREQQIERTVDDIGRFHERQHRRDADAVVRAERGAGRVEVVALLPRPDRVDVEIEDHIRVLLADHVEMGLECERRGFLAARRCALADHDVSGSIGRGGESVRCRHLADILPHSLLVLRPPGDGENAIEVAPEKLRLETAHEGFDEGWRGGHAAILDKVHGGRTAVRVGCGANNRSRRPP